MYGFIPVIIAALSLILLCACMDEKGQTEPSAPSSIIPAQTETPTASPGDSSSPTGQPTDASEPFAPATLSGGWLIYSKCEK